MNILWCNSQLYLLIRFLLICSSSFVFVYGQNFGRRSPEANCNTSTNYLCKNSSRCIPQSWLCDDDDDCGGNEDESNCENKTCGPNSFKCLKNNKCIPYSWVCDTEDDCEDKSDEHINCTAKLSTPCPSGFYCNESQYSQCIPNSRKCDGNVDCDGGEDERYCPTATPITCKASEFKCQNGLRCIPNIWFCDEDDDCGDNSDEDYKICNITCKQGEFECKDALKTHGRRCIPYRWRCDGEPDCRDFSDEHNCENVTEKLLHSCNPSFEFRCADGYCIHKKWKCDGDFDCPDMTDEDPNVCKAAQCSANEFMCEHPKHCIDKSKRCNGIKDCHDSSDENKCPTTTVKPVKGCNESTEFDCGGGECISLDKACDDIIDCKIRFGSDELPRNKNCSSEDDKCKDKKCDERQACRNTKNGPVCECRAGFTTNGTQCIDIDECKDTKSWCSHVCFNIIGSYRCVCFPGYILAPDHRTCLATGETPKLWVTSKNHVREFDIATHRGQPKLEELDFAVAMDFHYRKNLVIWSDLGNATINSCEYKRNQSTNATTCARIILKENISTPDGLAIDWIHDLLYWTDAQFNMISMASLDGKYRKTLFNSGLDEPRAIALDPRKGVLFWTDWGDKPQIEISGMDGSDRRALINDPKFVAWPNGLTLDLVKERVYFADAKLKHIISCNYQGKELVTVLRSWKELNHPFGLTLFEDRVYWSDWESEGIHYANKFDGSKPAVIAKNVFGSTTIRVHHEMSQPLSDNKCGTDHGCEHFCAPTSHLRTSTAARTTFRPFMCLCSDGYTLHENGKNCSNGTIIIVENVVTSTSRSNVAMVGLTLSLIIAVASFVCCVGWVLWKRQRKTELQRWTFGDMIYRNGAGSDAPSNVVDSYDHLQMSFDDSRHFNEVYQPTTTTNYVLNVGGGSGRSSNNSKDAMKLPLTENMYDDI